MGVIKSKMGTIGSKMGRKFEQKRKAKWVKENLVKAYHVPQCLCIFCSVLIELDIKT